MSIGSRRHRHKLPELPWLSSESPRKCHLQLLDTSVLLCAPQRNKHWVCSLLWEGANIAPVPGVAQQTPGASSGVKTAEVQKLLMTQLRPIKSEEKTSVLLGQKVPLGPQRYEAPETQLASGVPASSRC